jgi:hypothetical protein
MATSRYVVECGPDQIRAAFAEIVKLCVSSGITAVELVVPKKGGWENMNVAQFIGSNGAKALSKGTPVLLAPGVTMTLQSAQTFRGYAFGGMLVGAHIALNDMKKLDDSYPQAIVYLPWNDIEGQEWQATWNAQTIGPKTWTSSASPLPPAVEEALSSLTRLINLGTGLDHPSDKEHAVRAMAKLQAEGHSLDPVEIRHWAQRHGWSSGAASDLEKVVRKQR